MQPKFELLQYFNVLYRPEPKTPEEEEFPEPICVLVNKQHQIDHFFRLLLGSFLEEEQEVSFSPSQSQSKSKSKSKSNSNNHNYHEHEQIMVVGFDCEYDSFRNIHCIQLATKKFAGIILVNHLRNEIESESESKTPEVIFPDSFSVFLRDPRILKAGVGVQKDFERVSQQFNLECNGAFDISALTIQQKVSTGYRSLGDLSKDLLNIIKEESIGLWYLKNLSLRQIRYAVKDAWLSYLIPYKIYSSLHCRHISFSSWCHEVFEDVKTIAEAIGAYHVRRERDGPVRTAFVINGRLEDRTLGKANRKRKLLHEKRASKGYYRKKLESQQDLERALMSSNENISHLLHKLKQNETKKKKKKKLKENQISKDDHDHDDLGMILNIC